MLSVAFIDVLGLPYDGTTLQKRGLGGSETAVVSMARELSSLGFSCYVFNDCYSDECAPGLYEGVHYIPLHEIENYSYFDCVIVSRTIVPFFSPAYPTDLGDLDRVIPNFQQVIDNSSHRVLWMHDTFCHGDEHIESLILAKKIDKIFTLSDWHTNYITNCNHGGRRRDFELLKKNIWQTRNGINKWLNWVDIKDKDPNLFFYNSSYTKGMEPLVSSIWPEVHKRLPEARLKVIGGYYKFKDSHGPDQQQQDVARLQQDFDGKFGIEFTGVITQKQVAEIAAKSSFMVYPPIYPETFGISTLESLYYNTPLITCNFGALEETGLNEACYKLDYAIAPHVYSPWINYEEQKESFINLITEAHKQKYILQQKQNYCNIVKEVAEWKTVALEWAQYLYTETQNYAPLDITRRAEKVKQKVCSTFNRKYDFSKYKKPPKTSEKHLVVITCNYNSENYLKKCIDSIKAQDYDNYTVYIIDDVSTDNSIKVIEENINDKFVFIKNTFNKGAVRNQVETLKTLHDDDIVLIIDADDALVNNPFIFDFYNNLYDDEVEFTYGSCWSLADNIPLVAQQYPPEIGQSKKYRNHLFNWNIPYTHLRTFKKHLINSIKDEVFIIDGEWVKAGGDTHLFYSLIEQTSYEKVKAVSEIHYLYNDLNPINDYKINAKEQNSTASKSFNMIDKNILIAIPTDKNICPETFKSIYDLEIPMGYKTTFQYFYGYQIDQIRNLIAEWGKRFDYTFCVDSDIVLPQDALKKLLEADKDIISGLYRRKIDNNLELYEEVEGFGQTQIAPERIINSGIQEVSGCGFGCVLVKQNVFSKIPYPHFEYISGLTMEETVSEDILFGNKAKEYGYKIFADTSVLCGHIGMHTFNIDTTNIDYNSTYRRRKALEGYSDMLTPLDRMRFLYDKHPTIGIPVEHMDYLKQAVPNFLDTSKKFIVYDIGSELLHWTRQFNHLFSNADIYKFEGNLDLKEFYEEKGVSNYAMGALSSSSGMVEAEINNEINAIGLFEENLLKRVTDPATTNYKQTLQTFTLQEQVDKYSFPDPDLIKMDIQGAELDVIKGSVDIVKKAKIVILELQHDDYMMSAPKEIEVIKYMENIGFENLGEFYRNGFDGDYLFVNVNK